MEKKEEKKKAEELKGKDHFKEWEYMEMARDQMVKTDYPKPNSRYRLVYESFQASIEETYFWLLDNTRYNCGFPEIHKTIDLFTASEMSAFWGVQQQRMQLQQEQVSKHLANIGGFVKQLFQMVRELRIIDERLSLYEDANSKDSPSRNSAETSLKGLYVDVVEGGAKNPSSVLGLGSQLQFTSLPDLFFTTHPVSVDEVDKVIDKMAFNERVKSVLRRKLRSYLTWKIYTEKELKNRRSFMLKYLRHHYNIVQMYINWIKPYLKNVRRLTSNPEATESPDIVGAFEGSIVEVEFLARAMPEGNRKHQSIILLHIEHRTRPSMSYQAEGYQRGPIHVGRIDIVFRSYVWTNKDVKNYMKMREEENLEIMKVADGSLKAAMEALGEDLKRYLEEEGEKMDETEKEEPKSTNPFSAVIGGFVELFGSFVPKKKGKAVDEEIKLSDFSESAEKDKAKTLARKALWQLYKYYKKGHKMVTWQ